MLLTYSLKGMVRTDLCVYFNQEEYAQLEEAISEINHLIDKSSPIRKKTVLTGYLWKLTAMSKMIRIKMVF